MLQIVQQTQTPSDDESNIKSASLGFCCDENTLVQFARHASPELTRLHYSKLSCVDA
jgi:hypothetical protein